MTQAYRTFNRSLPILSIDLAEDRFRFTATVTAGAAALRRLARFGERGRPDPFGRIVMERAPHVAEQAGLIGTRQLVLDRSRRDVYREPIQLAPV